MKYIKCVYQFNKIHFSIVFLVVFSLTCFVFYSYGITIKSAVVLCFIYGLIALTFIDIRTQYLPDIITIPLIFWGVVQSIFGITTDIKSSIIGAIVGFGVFWLINALFKLIDVYLPWKRNY